MNTYALSLSLISTAQMQSTLAFKKLLKNSPSAKMISPKQIKKSAPNQKDELQRSYALPRGRWIRDEILCKDAAGVAHTLGKYGVAIMPGVVSRSQCETDFDAVMRDLEKIVPTFKYADSRTWPNLRRDGHALHTMLFQHLGIAWAQSVVNIRQNPKLSQIFAELWTELDRKRVAEKGPYRPEDMLASSDGIAALLNKSDYPYGWYKDGSDWLHCDRSHRSNVTSVQAFVNFCDTRSADVRRNACFEALLGSHQYRKEFIERFPDIPDVEFNLLQTQAHLDFYIVEKKCEVVFVDAKAGDMVFFTSSIVHQGKPAERQPNSDVFAPAVFRRLVVYISMQPRFYATPKDIEKKRKAFDELRGTRHCAARGVELFSYLPRMYSRQQELAAKPLEEHPILNNVGKRQWALETHQIAAKKKQKTQRHLGVF